MARPRVLAIAEAANPEWVSVPLVGWSLANALREVADVHVVTQLRNRDAFLRQGWAEGSDFTALDSERFSRPMSRIAYRLTLGRGKGWTVKTALDALAYPYFEGLAWQRFGTDIRAGAYDIVHRITPLTPTTVSPLAARCAQAGVPFVLGPLNGGVPWPPGFDAERRREREWLSYVRGLYKLMPGRSRMLTATRAILAGSRHTAGEVPARFQDRVVWLPENAIDPTRFNKVAAQLPAVPLRACFIGRLVPYKGPDMLLEAAAPFLRDGRLALDVIGDGPMMDTLRAQAAQDGTAAAITFHGKLPHAAVQDVAVRANLLTFPSIREFGGGVVLEAMALGVVPVIVDYAGPGELVTPETGFKIPLTRRNGIVAAFRDRLAAILADPSALPAMGQAARARVQAHFTWEAKARQVARVYDWVLKGGDRPELIDA